MMGTRAHSVEPEGEPTDMRRVRRRKESISLGRLNLSLLLSPLVSHLLFVTTITPDSCKFCAKATVTALFSNCRKRRILPVSNGKYTANQNNYVMHDSAVHWYTVLTKFTWWKHKEFLLQRQEIFKWRKVGLREKTKGKRETARERKRSQREDIFSLSRSFRRRRNCCSILKGREKERQGIERSEREKRRRKRETTTRKKREKLEREKGTKGRIAGERNCFSRSSATKEGNCREEGRNEAHFTLCKTKGLEKEKQGEREVKRRALRSGEKEASSLSVSFTFSSSNVDNRYSARLLFSRAIFDTIVILSVKLRQDLTPSDHFCLKTSFPVSWITNEYHGKSSKSWRRWVMIKWCLSWIPVSLLVFPPTPRRLPDLTHKPRLLPLLSFSFPTNFLVNTIP